MARRGPRFANPATRTLWLGGPAFGSGASCGARCGTSDDPPLPPAPELAPSFDLLGSAHAPPQQPPILLPSLPAYARSRPFPPVACGVLVLFLPLSHTHILINKRWFLGCKRLQSGGVI